MKRSANITYSSTTAGDLSEIANTTQSFDWSLIEEAGKAHGFDVVLPLQTGHRWVLIGDQFQLPPYRLKNFQQGLNKLDEVVQALGNLRESASLVDIELIRSWKAYNGGEKNKRETLWRDWLKFFGTLHTTCHKAIPTETGETPLADMLWEQHRMHPTIAGLISSAYYDGRIQSKTWETEGKDPLERVLHPFVGPADIAGKAIVWVDVPWRQHGGQGESEQKGPYTAPEESDAVLAFIKALRANSGYIEALQSSPGEEREKMLMTMAVLSPYKLQVYELGDRLKKAFQRNGKPEWLSPPRKNAHGAFTVDSFQGDQARVIIVSLVRNNIHPNPKSALGFLEEDSRMNVLFSRAECLLVLVGSWDFFKHQVRDMPADSARDFGSWRKAIDYLEKAFVQGTAIRIPASSLYGGDQ